MKSIVTIIFIALSAIANAQNAYDYVPGSAQMVFSMNVEQLNKKSGDINYLKYLKPILKSQSYGYYTEGCELININDALFNTNTYGINASNNVIMYRITIDKTSGSVFVFTLNNPEKFEAQLMAKCENKKSIQKRSTVNGSFYLSDKESVAINGNIAVVFNKDYNYYESANSSISQTDAYDSTYKVDKRNDNYRVDSLYFELLNSGKISIYPESTEDILDLSDTTIAFLANKRHEEQIQAILEIKYKDLLYKMESFVQVQADGIYKNRNFSKILSQNDDASIFINSSSLLYQSNFGMNSLLWGSNIYNGAQTLPNQNLLSSGINAFYSMNFLNGAASIKFRSTYNDKAFSYIKSIFDVKQNKKILKYIDGKNLLGYMSIAINNKEMGRLYGDMYAEILNNLPQVSKDAYLANIAPAMQLIYAFIDKEMLYNTIDGRAILACTGFENMKVTYKTYKYDDDFNRKEVTEERLEKQAKMLAVMSIGNYENAKKLFDIISKFNVFTKLRENVISLKAMRNLPFNLYLVLKEDAFIMTNDANIALNETKFNNLNDADKSNIMTHNMAMNIKIQEVMGQMKEFYPNGEDGGMLKFMENYGMFEMVDEKPSDNMYGASAVLHLKDGSENSLYTILKTMKAIR
jgi:hypothetical protein